MGQLDYALGGCFVLCGYPLIPLDDRMLNYTKDEAKEHVSYHGTDMNWMMFHGEYDPVFPPKESADWAFKMYDLLDVNDTILYDYTKPGNWHMEDYDYFNTMMTFVRTGEVVPITPKAIATPEYDWMNIDVDAVPAPLSKRVFDFFDSKFQFFAKEEPQEIPSESPAMEATIQE